MAKTIAKFRNSDVDFKMQANFDLREWEALLSRKVNKNILLSANKYFQRVINKRFTAKAGPTGKRWPMLHPATRKYKGSSRMLVYKGRLKKSLRGTIYKNELRLSTSRFYAPIQQFGATIKTTPRQSLWMWFVLFKKTREHGNPFSITHYKIPSRPFLWFNKMDVKKVEEIVKREVKKSERMGKGAV